MYHATIRYALLLAAMLPLAAVAQNPYTTAPRNYTLELDNDWVRVSRAIYRPGDKLPEHQHPDLPTVFVYLTDGGPVHFSHIHPAFTAKRSPVKKGGIRYHSGSLETHVVEYPGDIESEFLRIELKTERPEKKSEHVRKPPEDRTPFENGQMRISRAVCAPRQACPSTTYPAVIVNLNDRSFAWHTAGAPQKAVSVETVRIELKTKPSGEKK
ncbi:MAG: hypothetical protein HY820_30140 [Acidobacteria bacterium]|nr:hypothetical protein [Acidobacteriota bacterium]